MIYFIYDTYDIIYINISIYIIYSYILFSILSIDHPSSSPIVIAMPSYVQVLMGRANVLTTWWLEIVAGRPPKPSAPWNVELQGPYMAHIWLIYGWFNGGLMGFNQQNGDFNGVYPAWWTNILLWKMTI